MTDEVFDEFYSHIKRGRLEAVTEYLNSGGDPNLTNRNGWSLLMSAAFKGNSRILRLLLERGATLEPAGSGNKTALMFAAAKGHVKCVKLLLAHGASVHGLASEVESIRYYAMKQAVQFFNRSPAEVDQLLEVAQLLSDAGATSSDFISI